MADGQRVLLVGASFETLELLADADVRELVIVSDDADPDAPAGETAKGAPLRLRPDYKERARSKDVIVDPAGIAPADEVERLLKKQGVYLTLVPSPALDALPFGGEVQASEAAAVVLAPTEGPSEMVEALVMAGERRPGPMLYVAGKTAVELPAVACLRGDVSAAVDSAALEAARAEARDAAEALSAAHDELARLRAGVTEAQAATAEANRRADAAEGQIGDRAALEAELAAARRAADEARAALAEKSSEFDELEAEFEGVRVELAERRVDDRRFESLRTRFEAARSEMGREVAELRARLRDLDGPADDAAELIASRDRARTEAQRLLARLADTLERLAPERRLPATPVYGDSEASAAAIDAWLEVVETVVESTAAELAGLRAEQAAFAERMGQLVARVREQHAALSAHEAERAERAEAFAPAAVEAGADELRGRVEALEAALDSERGLRAAERAERLRAIDAAQAAEARLDVLRQRVVDERRAAASAALASAAAEDQAARLRLEIDRRAARAADLEEMITAHDRMEGLLTEALHVAEARVETAESARRVAEANLSVLRGEYERLQGAAG